MFQKSLSTLLIVLVFSSTVFWMPVPKFAAASPATLKVPDEYPTIQAAIDAAFSGDIVLVTANTYRENLVISKSLTIMGESRETTIIDGDNVDCVFNISRTNNVKVAGFTIQNAAKAVVYLERTNGSVISDTTVRNGTKSGIYVDRYSQSNTITRNTIQNNTEAGIYLDGAGNNTVSRNVVVWNGYHPLGSFSAGIYLDYGARYNKISQNNVTLNNRDGIYLVFSDNNTIEGNTVSKNLRGGVVLSSSDSCVVFENELFENSFGVQMWGPLTGHVLCRNNFIQNTAQLYRDQASGIAWDNGAEGNYWSDYAGEDLNGDGIGETFTPHLGVDNHPLVEPWSYLRVFDAYVWSTKIFRIATYSNSTVASFDYNHTLKQVRFNVTGPSGALGFCNVTISRGLTRSPWLILIDEANVTANTLIVSNVSHTSLHFNYTFSTHMVKIIGTGGLDVSPPVAEAGSDQTAIVGTEVTLNASLSTDNVGIVTYEWNLGDKTTTQSGLAITYIYTKVGTYVVTLTVKDAAENAATDSLTITVVEAPSQWWIWVASAVILIGTLIAAIFLINRMRKKPQ